MLIVYNGFNTFINFPVFSILQDPFNKIPFFFYTSGLEYSTRGGIQQLLVLVRKPGIKICKYNFLGELMVGAFEHQRLQSPPSLSDALSIARPKVVDVVPVLVNFTKRIKLYIKERHKLCHSSRLELSSTLYQSEALSLSDTENNFFMANSIVTPASLNKEHNCDRYSRCSPGFPSPV